MSSGWAGSVVGCATRGCWHTGAASGCHGVRTAPIADACCGCVAHTPTIGGDAMKSTGISPTTAIVEAMASPAVVIAPARPWAHPQEDAIVEITRAIITHRCACVG